jgi:hypothetical protein
MFMARRDSGLCQRSCRFRSGRPNLLRQVDSAVRVGYGVVGPRRASMLMTGADPSSLTSRLDSASACVR